jgi:hypothetical protein
MVSELNPCMAFKKAAIGLLFPRPFARISG